MEILEITYIFAPKFSYMLKFEFMDKALRKLEGLLSNAVNLGERIRLEGAVYRAELSERQKLGLTGDAAVKHYNDYMDRFGMSYLKVQ